MSSSIKAFRGGEVWYVKFDYGVSYSSHGASGGLVRLVRSGQ